MVRRKSEAVEQFELPFTAAFEGPAVDAGRMDTRDFAQSLLATSELLETAADTYFGFPGLVTVQVKADFHTGSFEFGLVVASAGIVGQQILTNLSLSDLEVLLRAIGYLGRSPRSLLRLILRVGSGKIREIQPKGDGTVDIHVEGDNNHITVISGVDTKIGSLLISDRVREAVADVVAPLKKPGIESYRVGPDKKPTLRVTKGDLPKLQSLASSTSTLADSVAVTALELLSPNFVDGNKWRVAQGGEPFWVRMLDEGFLEAIDRGEQVFMKGDYLIVELRTKAYSSSEGLGVERDILRVIDHRHRAKQLGFG